jgi:ureidoglycolate lyase
VTYRPGVWHHGLTALAAPAEFAVFMSMTLRDDDDEFWNVTSPLYVVQSIASGEP